MASRRKTEKPAFERLSDWLTQHRSQFPTNALFAREIQISEGRLSQVLNGSLPSPQLTVRIQRATGNAILSEAWFKNMAAQAVRA